MSVVRVLLVEDNVGDARLIREILSEVPERPFTLTTVGTLGDAVAVVAGHDVVLLDLSLPDADGLATIARMTQAAGKAPVVVLTGNLDDQVALVAVTLGADDYLLKAELSPSLLGRTMMYAIERRRSAENARRMFALELARAESVRSAERARFLADLGEELAKTLDAEAIARAVVLSVVPAYCEGACFELDTGSGKVERLYAQPNDLTKPEDAFVLPLVARDRVLGALTLALGARPVDESRRSLMEEVARRAALSLDNALLYRESQRALSARDELLAVVSHDLRNPLSVFGLSIASLRRAIDAGRLPARGSLDAAGRAVVRMQRLIEDLLDVARIDAGTLTLTRVLTDLSALLEDVSELHLALAVQKQIRLERRISSNLSLDIDRDRIHQLLSNLLGNALKFTPAGGRIIVAGVRLEARIRIEVTDSGPGVSPDTAPHVFDRFFQSSRKREGIGLGLAIAKGIADAHGGAIGVENAPGGGACFFLELPIPIRPPQGLEADRAV